MSAGIPASELSDEDLERELAHVHEKRHDIFLTGSADQLANNVARMRELEQAWLERFGEKTDDAEQKVQALDAGAGQRTVSGSVTEPLARGERTEKGWDADIREKEKAEQDKSEAKAKAKDDTSDDDEADGDDDADDDEDAEEQSRRA